MNTNKASMNYATLKAARETGRLLVLLGDCGSDKLLANSDGGWLTEIARQVQIGETGKADIFEKIGTELTARMAGCEIFHPKPKKVRDVFDEAALASSFDAFFHPKHLQLGEGDKLERPGDEIE